MKRLARICFYCGEVEVDFQGDWVDGCTSCGRYSGLYETVMVPDGVMWIVDEREYHR